jgi:hypothetical protein
LNGLDDTGVYAADPTIGCTEVLFNEERDTPLNCTELIRGIQWPKEVTLHVLNKDEALLHSGGLDVVKGAAEGLLTRWP